MSATAQEIPTAPLLAKGGIVTRLLIRIGRHPEATLAVVLVLLILVGGLFISSDVTTVGNMTLVFQAMVPQLAVGLGVSIALYAGIVDLSIGSTMGAAAMAFAVVTQQSESGNLALALAAAVGVGIGVAMVNTLLLVGFRVDPIVATLATLIGVVGVTYVIGRSQSQITNAFSFDTFAARRVGDIPLLFIVLIVMYVLAAIYMKKSRTGRHLLSVGAGPIPARRLGVKVDRIQIGCLLLCGIAAALGGVLSASNIGAATITLGAADMFIVFSGVLLGGFSIARGGVGSPLGALLGIAVLTVMLNILSNASVSAGWQEMAIGIMVLVAVALDRARYGSYAPSPM